MNSEDPRTRVRGRDPTGPSAPTPGIPLGHVFGVRIRADWSLLLIVGLVTLNLGAAFLLGLHPDWDPMLRWGVAFGAAVLFFVSILLHELAHAVVGRAFGMRVDGITLFMFGGVTHVAREPDRPGAELLMALAGPVTSFVIAFVSATIGVWLGGIRTNGAVTDEVLASMQQLSPLATLLLWLGPVNFMLAVFNLLPGFPLDGGRVVRALLWWATRDMIRATRWASFIGQLVAWALIAAGVSMVFGVSVPMLGRGAVQGIWLVLIGWFLNNAAQSAYQRVLLDVAVKGLAVRQLMDTHIDSVPPDLSVGSLLHERILHTEQRCFPVADKGELQGIVCLDDIRRVARSEWEQVPIARVMTPASELTALKPEDDASRAVELLANEEVDQIPVVEHGILQGLVRRRDVIRWVALQQGMV